jgi:hypothetical protein
MYQFCGIGFYSLVFSSQTKSCSGFLLGHFFVCGSGFDAGVIRNICGYILCVPWVIDKTIVEF